MSTALHDVASAAFLAAAVFPGTRTATVTGTAVDLLSADGPCFAVQQVGELSEDTTLTGTIEESATGTDGWAAIPGAAFAEVGGGNNLQVVRFTRTRRYVRYVGTISGETPSVDLAVLIGQQKKTL